MKWLVVGLLFFLGINMQAQVDLAVKIVDLKGEGKLLLAVYNSQENFLKDEGIFRHVVLPVEGEEMEFVIEDLPEDEYAVAFMIDENGNDKMDFYFFGMPKEKYGLYTDPGFILSRPKFKTLSFDLKENMSIEMKPR